MNPVSLGLNLLLATLLALTLALGWRLNKRLKTMREGQEIFVRAVADLDRAASRAEKGLADLRAATDEAVEFLSGRIDKGRELAAKLERLTASAAASLDAAPPSRIAAMEQLWAKPANEPMPRPVADHEAAAESLALKLSEVLDSRPTASVQTLSPRSRASVDDDLFDSPARAPAFDASPRAAARLRRRSLMARIPRILPLVAVAIGGVLAVNAVRGAPNLIGAAQSFAEDIAAPKGAKAATAAASPLNGSQSIAAKPPAPVCAPTAAELAKEAGLSPAELQVLQSLGNRRGELDQREQSLDTQVQLIAAAEAKLDDRIKEMNSLKQNIQDLIGQADAKQQAETDRLVTVYEKMKPAAAAARMTLLDDSVRLPIAAKMKPAILSAILGLMAPEDAKTLTEKLAHRLNGSAAITSAQNALNPPPTPATTPPATAQKTPPTATADATNPAAAATTPPAAKPRHVAKARPRPKPKTDAPAVAANDKAAAGDTTAKTPAAAPAVAKPTGAAATPAATPAAGKSG